ncbi:asparagine synthase-related protein [Glaciimonas immobilis]|uniref:asparagine synthase (glutamine-hydrolyzing) n=1 Tax=Glaciimonas immobilis TaxID=728004 RepID=A0A840RY48_9BURK|nr:asparagine synthase-related protein [Glaciimonas immobilis]KAF3998593.1 hypothetical protein HAV38_06990 [Glaciimonas immobilis]MBB5201451.1 hypothetical protein [Glaciimonas immobilis]
MKKIIANEFEIHNLNYPKSYQDTQIRLTTPDGNFRNLSYFLYDENTSFNMEIYESKLIIKNGLESTRSFYISTLEDQIIFSSDLTKILGCAPEIDISCALNFIFLGEVNRLNTIWKGVSIVPPGTSITIDYSSKKLDVSTTFLLDEIRSPCSNLYAVIAAEIRKNANECDGIIIEFSGGLDSTTLMYAAHEVAAINDKKILAATWASNGCSSNDDVNHGAKIALSLGIEHVIFDIDPDMLFEVITVDKYPDNPSVAICFEKFRRSFIQKSIEKLNVKYPLILNGHGGDHVFYASPTVHMLREALKDKGLAFFLKKSLELSCYRRVGLVQVIKEYLQRKSETSYVKNRYIKPSICAAYFDKHSTKYGHFGNGEEFRNHSIEQALCENSNSKNRFENCHLSFPLTSSPVISYARDIPVYDLFNSTQDRLVFREEIFARCNSAAIFRRTKGHVTGVFQKSLYAKREKIRDLVYNGYLYEHEILDLDKFESTLISSSIGLGGIPYDFMKIIAFELFVKSWDRRISERKFK